MTPIKVTYTEPGSKLFYTRIFDNSEEAIRFLKGKPSALMFEMDMENTNTVSWKILPYGDYRAFKIGLFVKDHLLEICLLLLAAGYAIYRHLNIKKEDPKPASAPAAETPKDTPINEPEPKVELADN